MPRSSELRERAAQALERAREIERREAEAAEPLSAEDQAAHTAAHEEVESLTRQADEIDERARRSTEAEARLRESQQRGATPSGRQGRSLVNDADRDGLPMPHNDPTNTRNGRHGYSLMRALRGFARHEAGEYIEGLEGEVHQEMSRHKRTAPQGVLIPLDAPLARGLCNDPRIRALDTTAGAGAIQTTVVPTLIDFLRAQLVTARLGATILSGVTGPFSLPKQTAVTAAYWVAEGADVTPSNATVGQVPFTPKTVGALTSLTRRFINTSQIDAEAFAQADVLKTIADGLERAALNGSGASNQPKGVLQYGGAIGTIAVGTNGGPLTWKLINDMIASVNTANVMSDRRAFLFNELTASKLRSTPKEGTHPVYLYEDGQVAGYPVDTTTILPSNLTKGTSEDVCSAAIYGNWSDLIIAMFSAIDIVWDPYTQAASGGTRLVGLLDADINLRYPEAFCICTDITTT